MSIKKYERDDRRSVTRMWFAVAVSSAVLLAVAATAHGQVKAGAAGQVKAAREATLVEKFKAGQFLFIAGVGRPALSLERFGVNTSYIKGLWVITNKGVTLQDLQQEGKFGLLRGSIEMFQIPLKPASFFGKLQRKLGIAARGLSDMNLYTQDPLGPSGDRGSGSTMGSGGPEGGGGGTGCEEGMGPDLPTGGAKSDVGERLDSRMSSKAEGGVSWSETYSESGDTYVYTAHEDGTATSEIYDGGGNYVGGEKYNRDGSVDVFASDGSYVGTESPYGVSYYEGEDKEGDKQTHVAAGATVSGGKETSTSAEEESAESEGGSEEGSEDSKKVDKVVGGGTDDTYCAGDDPSCTTRAGREALEESKVAKYGRAKSKMGPEQSVLKRNGADPRVEHGVRPPRGDGGGNILGPGAMGGKVDPTEEGRVGYSTGLLYNPCGGNMYLTFSSMMKGSPHYLCSVMTPREEGGFNCMEWSGARDFSKAPTQRGVKDAVAPVSSPVQSPPLVDEQRNNFQQDR